MCGQVHCHGERGLSSWPDMVSFSWCTHSKSVINLHSICQWLFFLFPDSLWKLYPAHLKTLWPRPFLQMVLILLSSRQVLSCVSTVLTVPFGQGCSGGPTSHPVMNRRSNSFRLHLKRFKHSGEPFIQTRFWSNVSTLAPTELKISSYTNVHVRCYKHVQSRFPPGLLCL